jgi:ABC-2 type transport system ATP-binding protein
MAQDIAIKVDHVSKEFKLPHEKQTSIKSALINMVRGGKRTYERQQVLKSVSFEIHKGEFFGIVGRNGSGKSTLLKMLAGIYMPTKGGIEVNGKLTPFIELGVGFNPELTGRENVFLNGALLGFNRKEMEVMYDDIVAFAEIEKFMDQKLKNYSSGMQVRLAFSIAIRANTEILLLDEVLAVGDAAFQRKCFDYFAELKREGRTVILVTHDMANVERFCDRALLINDGHVLEIGNAHDIATTYTQLNAEHVDTEEVSNKSVKRWGNRAVEVAKIQVNGNSKRPAKIQIDEPVEIQIRLNRKEGYEHTPIVCGLAFYNEQGLNLAGPNSLRAKIAKGATTVTYRIPTLPFAAGTYRVTVAVYNEQITEPFDYWDAACIFHVEGHAVNGGAIELRGTWKGGK